MADAREGRSASASAEEGASAGFEKGEKAEKPQSGKGGKPPKDAEVAKLRQKCSQQSKEIEALKEGLKSLKAQTGKQNALIQSIQSTPSFSPLAKNQEIAGLKQLNAMQTAIIAEQKHKIANVPADPHL